MDDRNLQLIVVGIDGSPAAAEALAWGVAEAGLTGARVEALYVWDPTRQVASGSPRRDWHRLRRTAERHAVQFVESIVDPDAGVQVVPRMVIGRAAQVLVEASAGADLLILGSRGIAGLEGIEQESVSHHCAAYAECPVLIVRHDPLRPRRLPRPKAPAAVAGRRA